MPGRLVTALFAFRPVNFQHGRSEEFRADFAAAAWRAVLRSASAGHGVSPADSPSSVLTMPMILARGSGLMVWCSHLEWPSVDGAVGYWPGLLSPASSAV